MRPTKENRVSKIHSQPSPAQNVSWGNQKPPILPQPPGAIRLFGSIRRLWNAVIPVVRNPKPAITQPALPSSPSSPALFSTSKQEGDSTEDKISASDPTSPKVGNSNRHLHPSVTFDTLPSSRVDKNSSPPQQSQSSAKRHVSTSTSYTKLPRVDANASSSSVSRTTTRQFRRESPVTVPPRRLSERITEPENCTKGDSSPNGAMTSTKGKLPSSTQPSLFRKGASLVSHRRAQPSSLEGDQTRRPYGGTEGQPQRVTSKVSQQKSSLFFGFRYKDRSNGGTSAEVSDAEGEPQWKVRRGRKPTVREIIAEGRAAERAAKEKVQLKKLRSSRALKDVDHVNVEGATSSAVVGSGYPSGKQVVAHHAKLSTVSSHQNDVEDTGTCDRAATSSQTARLRQSRLLERGQRWKDKLRDSRNKQNQLTSNKVSSNLLKRSSSCGVKAERNVVERLNTTTGLNEVMSSGSSSQHGQRLSDLFEDEIHEGDLSPIVRPSTVGNDLQDVWRIRLASYTRRMMENGSRSILSAPASPKGGGTMILSQIGSPAVQAPARGYGPMENTTSSPVCKTCLYKALTELPEQNTIHGRRGSLGSPVTECDRDRISRSKVQSQDIQDISKDSSAGRRLDQLYHLLTQLREHEQWKSLRESALGEQRHMPSNRSVTFKISSTCEADGAQST